jgi:hypothetical protein
MPILAPPAAPPTPRYGGAAVRQCSVVEPTVGAAVHVAPGRDLCLDFCTYGQGKEARREGPNQALEYNLDCTAQTFKRQEDPLMDQVIPSLQSLLDPLSCCFRAEVFSTFSVMTAAWIACLGRRSVSRVWETTGRSN